ncbi:MAG: GGDEF domain-containing protein [Kangiellaceae bacterium]|nr:GGDEF domain-containing protein [Kangiellaceae bacterium]
MYSDDDVDFANKLHEKAVAVLQDQQLPLTPLNYSVIYSYISLRQPKLTESIKRYLASGNRINNQFLRETFDEYILGQKRFEEELIKPIDGMIESMIKQIGAQVKSEEEMAVALKEVGKRLSSSEQKSDVEDVVADLGGITDKARREHQELFQELTSAQDEIFSLKKRLEASEKEAITDPLTGLLNRRGMQQKLEDIDSPIDTSCIIIDIDHFKGINDNFGHLVGDRIIKRVTSEIKKHIRGRDLAVRFGGEEFAILLIDTPIEGAKKVAETLRKKVDSLKLVIKSNKTQLPSISISLGIASFDTDLEWDNLFKRADDALYAAKQGGRNQTRFVQGQDFLKVDV